MNTFLFLLLFSLYFTTIVVLAAANPDPDPDPLPIMLSSSSSSSLPYVLITSADKLNGYTAVKYFATHFTVISPSPSPSMMTTNLMADTEIGGRSQFHLHTSDNINTKSSPSSSLYRLHCTVTDPQSQFALLAKDLGCELHTIPPHLMQSPSHWESIFSQVTKDQDQDQINSSSSFSNDTITPPMYLVWIPDMHPNAHRDLEAALSAIYHHPAYKHTIIWSRHGIEGNNTHDLITFNWYHNLEQVALSYQSQYPHTITILRLGFGIERLLDLVPDIEDEAAFRLPLGDSGTLLPISLHDAVWACHTIFTASQQGHLNSNSNSNNNNHGYKPIMELTSTNLISGSQLAISASRVLGIPISYQAITREKARDILLSLENMTPHLVLVLLDVFECAQRPSSACHIPASYEDIITLLPNGRKLKDPDWFFNKYRDAFAPGGVDR